MKCDLKVDSNLGKIKYLTMTDASKVALVHLVARLRTSGYHLLDTQFKTPHLETLGVMEISKDEYQKRLKPALQRKCSFMSGGDHIKGSSALSAVLDPDIIDWMTDS